MKQLFSFVLLCSALIPDLRAQDIIILTNSTRIEAQILEVSSKEIRYKKANFLDGPTFVVETEKIQSIHYRTNEVVNYRSGEVVTEAESNNSEEYAGVDTTFLPSDSLSIAENGDVNEINEEIEPIEESSFKAKPTPLVSNVGVGWSQTRWSIHLGIGLQNMVGATYVEYASIKHEPNFAWRVGADVSIPLSVGIWMIDVAIGTRGWHGEQKSIADTDFFGQSLGVTSSESYHIFNFQLTPFMYAYDFQCGPVVIRPYAGPYFSFDFAGIIKSAESVKGSGNGIAGGGEWKYSIWDKGEKTVHQFIQMGLNFGADIHFLRHMYAGVMFQAGFLQYQKKSFREKMGSNYKSGSDFTFLCRIGYVF